MLKLLLYTAGDDDDSKILRQRLISTLTGTMSPGTWKLEVVDVIQMPEKALQHDVFATPTLLRELPEPVVKLIGDIAQTQRVIAIINGQGQEGQTLIV